MANGSRDSNAFKFLSFVSPEAEKELIKSLNLRESQIIQGQDYLSSYQPQKIRGNVIVLMPNRRDFVSRILLKVVRLTKKRVALVFFDGLPEVELGQAMHFEEILVWPCQEQLSALLQLEKAY